MSFFRNPFGASRNKSFAAPNSPGSRGTRHGGNVDDLQFSEPESDLQTLWSEYSTNITNDEKFSRFAEAFLLFPHDKHQISGHPTEVVHRITYDILSFIQVSSTGENKESWTGEQYLFHARKDWKLKSTAIIAQITSWKGKKGGEISLNYTNKRVLLCLQCIVKICSWRHNVDLILNLFGHGFFGLLFLLLHPIVSQFDELIVRLSDQSAAELESKTSHTVDSIHYLLALMFSIASIPSKLLLEDRKVLYGSNLGISSLPPYRIDELSEQGIDIVLRSVAFHLDRSDSVDVSELSLQMDPGQLRSIFARTKGPSSFLPAKQKAMDDIFSELIPNLSALLRKLYLLSKISADEGKRNEQGDGDHMDKLQRLVLIVQQEVVCAMTVIVYYLPQLLKDIKSCEGFSTVMAFILCKDGSRGSRLHQDVYGLILRRSIVSIVFHDVCLKSSTKQGKNNPPISFIAEVTNMLASLSALFAFIIENMNIEMSYEHVLSTVTSSLINTHVGCSCATSLNVVLPSTDLYPWNNQARVASKFQTLMTGVDEGSNGPAFTQALRTYWSARKSFFPTERKHVFEPSKSYIYAYLAAHFGEDSTSSNPAASSAWLNDPTRALNATYSMTYLPCIFRVLYNLVWRTTELTLDCKEFDLFFECTISCFGAMSGNARTIGELGFVLQTVLFLMKSFEKFPDKAAVLYAEKNYWPSLLENILMSNASLKGNMFSTNAAANGNEKDSIPLNVGVESNLRDKVYQISLQLTGIPEVKSTGSFLDDEASPPMTPADINEAKLPKPEFKRPRKGSHSHQLTRLYYYYKLFVSDVVFEALWISCTFSGLGETQSDITTQANTMLGAEIDIVTDFLANCKNDLAVTYCFRWLGSLVQFCCRLNILKTLTSWEIALERGVECLKSIAEVPATPKYSLDNRRLLQWPAKVAVLDFICKLLFTFNHSSWIAAFIPASSMAQQDLTLHLPSKGSSVLEGGPDLKKPSLAPPSSNRSSSRNGKHLVLFGLVYDKYCQDYAVPVILRILLACAGSITKPTQTSNNMENNASVTIYDALAHDILKNILNSIKNHSQGSELEYAKAAKLLLFGLTALLKNPKLFQCEDEGLVDIKKIRRLFYTYGTMTPLHKQYFFWSRPRAGVIKDLMICLESSISAETTNHRNNSMYVELVKGSIALLTALTYNSFRFQEALKVFSAQDRRTKISKVVVNSIVVNNWGINDLGFVILCALEWNQQFYVFFVLIIEMLLNGLPSELILRAKAAEDNPGTDRTTMEDHAFIGLEESLIIRNTSAISLLSLLLPYFAEREQLYVLKSIIFLIHDSKSSLANITTCTKCKPSLIDYILDALDHLSPTAKVTASRLLRILAQFSVSVSELKRMIRSLRPDRDGGEYFRESSLLLEALRGTIANESDPQFYFLFDGDQSGIVLPSFETWPGASGYTFSTWIHTSDWILDSVGNIPIGLSQERTLFSCRQSNGTGVDIYLSLLNSDEGLKLVLCMSVFSANRPHIPLKKSICNILTLENENRGKWVFVGLAHSRGTFLTKSQVVAVINAEVYHTELGYPRFTDDAKYACIASLHPVIDGTSSSFRGRMSTIYFFSESLSEQVLLSMYFHGVLRSSELSETFDESIAVTPTGSFHDIVVLEYNPSVTTSDLVIDTTIENIQSKWKPLEAFDSKMSPSSMSSGKMHGKLMKGSHVFSSMAMKNALDCLGGSKVLFPLLYNANFVASTETEQNKVQEQFVQMVTMIQNSLDKSPESRRFMVTQGFAFLALFLENMDPKLISGDLITQLSKFLAFYPDDDEWTRQCLKSLFCNFSLWVLTPFETQEFLLRNLEVHASTKADLFREAVGVNYLFSVLYFQYSDQQLQRYQSVSLGKLEQPSWVNKWNQFYSLSPDQLRTIRGLMFQVIYQIIMQSKDDISKEISSIVSYVLHETNGSFKVDGLRLLIKLMNPEKIELAKRLIDAFVTCKGLLIVSHFCNHVRAKVRLYAWLVICNLITLALSCNILQTTAEATKYSSAAESNRRSTILGGSGKRKPFMPASQQSKQVAVESAIDPVFNEKPGQTKVEISVSGNVFSRLGVDESTIGAWFLFLSRSTVEMTAQHLLVHENLDNQLHILMQMLILTMFGQMSKFLLSDIEVLSGDVSMDGNPLPPSSMDPSDIYTSDYTFDDVFLEPRLLSVPMMFPSLIELFKFSRSSLEKRIVFLQKVTTYIEGMENYDIFMSIPKWQSLLLDVLVAERKQKEIDQHHGASLETLHVLSSTIGTIFTKLHAHSVLCGDLRAPRYHIELPCILSGPKYKDLDGKELFEMIRRDQRILGCGGIRKTVAFVRSYISAGLLKWDRLCFDMLAMIVEGLHSAIRQVQETAISDVDKDMRLRLFDINTWLTVESVGEFIAMPPVSVASKASNSSLSNMAAPIETSAQLSTPTPIRRVASAPPQLDMASSMSYDLNAPLAEAVEAAIVPQGSSEDMGDYPKDNSIKVEDNKAIDGIDLMGDFDSVILDHFSLPSAMNRRGTFDILTPALPNEPRLEDEEPIAYNFEHAFDATIWGTVNSMIDLLGITGKSLDSWFSHDRLWRLQAGLKVGFVRGRYVIKLVQESADSIMEDFEPSQKGENKNLNGKTHKHLLNRIVDQSIWLLIRILLNFAMQCDADEAGSASPESVSVQALLKLSQVLIWARSHAKHSYDNESLFVLAKLTLALRAGASSDNSIWSQLVLKIVDEIALSQTKYLIYCIQSFRSEGVAKSLKDFTSGNGGLSGLSSKMPSFPISPTSFLSTGGGEDDQKEKARRPSFSFSSPVSSNALPTVYAEDRASFSSDTSQGSLSNYMIGRIDRVLQVSGSRITWNEWSALMDTQLKVSADREKQLLSSKFDEFGLHKQAREVQSQMEIYVRAVDDAIMYYTHTIGLAVQKLTLNEQKILKEVIRGEALSKKRALTEWQEMYTTLSNERGPWGSGALSDDDKLWVLDPCEDDMRRKVKLATNDNGQNFLNAFLRRPDSSASSTNLEALVSEVVSKSTAGKEDREKLPIGTPISISKVKASATYDSSDDEDTPAKQSLRIANSELGLNIDMLKNLHRFRAESTSQSNNSGGDDFDSDEDFEKDNEDDEESLKKEEDTGKFSLDNEKILFSEPCEVVLPSSNSVNPPASGILEVTTSYIRFTRTQDIYSRGSSLSEITAARGRRPESQVCEALWACQPFPTTQWSTAEVVNILQRYYQLRFVAIELFTTNRKVFFFNLFQYNVASRFQLVLRKMVKPPLLEPFLGKRPIRIIEKISGPTPGQSLTIAWANREISNFDYLMKLNTIAGRTYNDLGQYPIFPWILADYTSETLNLRDRSIYRDLRWPVGAQDANQRQTMIAKYYDLLSLYDPDDDTSLPPFHYGTHYSVAGFVLWYLMRLEPYTSLHVQLQDGRIDRADRLLDSIDAAWRGCTSNPSDVKELIPEMFYNPEIFVNLNKVDFGKTQGHRKISDIVLPPWAKDPHDFIRKHRDALESEYVSKHLHHWIDLVFGCKQRPPHIPGGSQAAVDACNVFFHLTYENAVDLDKLRESNLQLYIQYMCQIAEFGQSPCQLFTKEHIPRAPLSKVDFIWPIASIVRGIHTIYEKEESVGMPRRMLCFKEAKVSLAPILAIIEEDEKLITVDGARILGIHHWQVNSADAVPPFKFRQDQVAFELSKGASTGTLRFGGYNKTNAMRERRLGVPFAPRLEQNHISRYTNHLEDKHESENNRESVTRTYRPMKVRVYEKEEKRETKRTLEHPLEGGVGGKLPSYAPTEPSTPTPSTPVGAGSVDGSAAPSPEASNAYYDNNNRNRTRSVSGESIRGTAGSSAPSTPHTSNTSNTSNQASAHPLHLYYNALLTNTRIAPSLQDEHISQKNFSFLSDLRLLLSCGHWDRSIRVTAVDTGRLVQSLRQHRDVVTCMSVGRDYGKIWLVTGSRDCTVVVWEVVYERGSYVGTNAIRTLHGHDDVVTCVHVQPDIDTLLSASEDGTVIMYSLREGVYIRTIVNRAFDITLPSLFFQRGSGVGAGGGMGAGSIGSASDSAGKSNRRYSRPLSGWSDSSEDDGRSRSSTSTSTPSANSTPSNNNNNGNNKTLSYQQLKIQWIGYSKEGYIVVYSAEYNRLTTFSLNGVFICSRRVPESLYALCMSEDGKVLVTGGSSCLVVFRWIHSLELANDGPRKGLECILDGSTGDYNIPAFPSPIRTLHLTKMERHLLVGLETGELRVLAHDPDYLRERLHHKLEELGIL